MKKAKEEGARKEKTMTKASILPEVMQLDGGRPRASGFRVCGQNHFH